MPSPPSDVPGSLPRARADRRVGSSASGAGRRLAGREQAAPGSAPGPAPEFAGTPRCAADGPAPAACGMLSCSSISRLRRMRSSRCPRPALPPVKPTLADCLYKLRYIVAPGKQVSSGAAPCLPSALSWNAAYMQGSAAVAPDRCQVLLCSALLCSVIGCYLCRGLLIMHERYGQVLLMCAELRSGT